MKSHTLFETNVCILSEALELGVCKPTNIFLHFLRFFTRIKPAEWCRDYFCDDTIIHFPKIRRFLMPLLAATQKSIDVPSIFLNLFTFLALIFPALRKHLSTSSYRKNSDSKTSNAERTARYVHEEKLKENIDGQTDTELLCRWFSIDRSTTSVRCEVISTMCPREIQMEQFFQDGQQDECMFTLTNMYLCFQTSVTDEEKRQQFLPESH
uniref:Uncharacterized protein n=1 Tax=Hyaloperonospora arabidopsidis (strain Emoy2) TaxID=559515 RepID=M4B816_HYAAE